MPLPPATGLPVETALPALREALRAGTAAVLQAPPGAGKTTLVPLALLDEPWLGGGRVVMLEPRRVAARAAAARMAALLGERAGARVGYRVRMDTRVGAATRIEVVTEGVLTRMLQGDPALEGVGAVIFDEFHERSLHADLGLALVLQSRELLRPDLRVLVMSATLAAAPVAELLGGAPVIRSEGRQHPVRTVWLERESDDRLDSLATRSVRQALEREAGDLLVFLPGAGEIRRVQALLQEGALPPGVILHPLFGNLTQAEQDRALAPATPGTRKVVLATALAETSLTIEGVRVVVDSGWTRVPRFSPRTGMSRLETVRVSRASADQRRGRAGRLGPGVCYRLWTEARDATLRPFRPAEILEADLAPLALELAVWGVRDAGELRWMDPPPAAALSQAHQLLRELGALDGGGAVTAHGRALAALPLHPRLAHMLLRGREAGLGATACALAALLGERDPLRGEGRAADADVRLRLALLEGRGAVPGHALDRGALQAVRAAAAELARRIGAADQPLRSEAAGELLALAYPDRIAQRRSGRAARYRLRNGRGAVLEEAQGLARAEWLVAAELDDAGREARVALAAPLERDELERLFAEQLETREVVEWDEGAAAVRARRETRLGALLLREAPLGSPDPARVQAAVLEGVRGRGLDALPWSRAAQQLRERIAFLHAGDAGFPDVSPAALEAGLEGWLGPHLAGVRRADELQKLDLAQALLGMLSWQQRRALDELAPTHLEVPSGSRIAVDYSDPQAPVLAVRLQEVFGWRETPRIAGGRVALTLHLLSPAQRPVQVTRDLASFWRSGYFEVKKDLKGRYPRHYWPDDPLQATPTRRVRPRE